MFIISGTHMLRGFTRSRQISTKIYWVAIDENGMPSCHVKVKFEAIFKEIQIWDKLQERLWTYSKISHKVSSRLLHLSSTSSGYQKSWGPLTGIFPERNQSKSGEHNQRFSGKILKSSYTNNGDKSTDDTFNSITMKQHLNQQTNQRLNQQMLNQQNYQQSDRIINFYLNA